MRKYFPFFWLICGLLSMGLSGCDTESNTENPDLSYFMKYYGGDGNQYGADMMVLNDGSFLLVGTSFNSSAESQLYIVRVDAEGEIIWDLRHGLTGERWTARDVEQTNDGNFAVVADYVGGTKPDVDIKLVKLSPEGNVITEAVHGTKGNDYSRTITPLVDGDFIISGSTDSTRSFLISGETDPDPFNAFTLRVDQNFSRLSSGQWLDVFAGFDNTDVAVKIFQPVDTVYYVFGHTDSPLAGYNTGEKMGLFYFRKNAVGTRNAPYYPPSVNPSNDTEINYVQSVAQPFGGGYLVVGTSEDNLDVPQIFLARLRETLTFQTTDAMYSKIVSLAANVRGVAGATSMSRELAFFILGNEVRSTGATNIWLTKVNLNGQVLWSTTIGSETESDTGAAVAELPDGRIAILGTIGLEGNQSKMALIKVNAAGRFLK